MVPKLEVSVTLDRRIITLSDYFLSPHKHFGFHITLWQGFLQFKYRLSERGFSPVSFEAPV